MGMLKHTVLTILSEIAFSLFRPQIRKEATTSSPHNGRIITLSRNISSWSVRIVNHRILLLLDIVHPLIDNVLSIIDFVGINKLLVTVLGTAILISRNNIADRSALAHETDVYFIQNLLFLYWLGVFGAHHGGVL